MLKKNLKSLLERSGDTSGSSFEVISDPNAQDVSGGTATCQKLETCVEYYGDCPNLTSCGTFNYGSGIA
ncbi:hypothetical protein FPZ42_07150 [Mucilaginibacter achroorhodeus]|uniref:Uncharacterized protein n=1 Tax=Mucilaginibacter achroorhodeus TaxID=2599294 RepID=A0A563U636_9SPHI|nr:hypothetical protein [Mucilaginibacter achroorhodeus]TWR26808.1 hypothetical protein FPZ42_07150 [Mucilaginibacter achroorhodeus]